MSTDRQPSQALRNPTPPTVVVTISTVADQLTLAAVFPTVSATINGAAATITAWAWKCNGATTLLANPTTATPTVTPTGAGQHTLSVSVTIGGVVYPQTAVEVFQVGDADGRYRTHQVLWADEAAGVIPGTVAIDGVTLTSGSTVSASGVTINLTSGIDAPADDIGPRALTDEDDVVFYAAVAATITTTGQVSYFNVLNAAGTYRGGVVLRHTGATHQVGVFQRRSGVDTEVLKNIASQARVVAVRFFRGILFEVRFSLTAFDGATWPAFSTMTEILSTNGSNSFTPQDASGAADTAPAPAISGAKIRHSANWNSQIEVARAIFVRSAL
jgi:hypothetical protein